MRNLLDLRAALCVLKENDVKLLSRKRLYYADEANGLSSCGALQYLCFLLCNVSMGTVECGQRISQN